MYREEKEAVDFCNVSWITKLDPFKPTTQKATKPYFFSEILDMGNQISFIMLLGFHFSNLDILCLYYKPGEICSSVSFRKHSSLFF